MKSAVERLTRMRQAESRDYISFCIIVTTDYEAMYAYRCGEFEKCLQFCEKHVRKLQSTKIATPVCNVPSTDLLLLLDDKCMSLVGLTVVLVGHVNEPEAEPTNFVCQITVSLYLLVQCKLQMRHSMTSLASVLRRVSRAYRRFGDEDMVDRVILAFIYRKARRISYYSQAGRW